MSNSLVFHGKNKLQIYSILGLFLANFIILMSGVSPSVYWLDSGELQAALPELGIPHSPSFPSYILSNHVSKYIPFGDMAFRANLCVVLTGAVLGLLVFIVSAVIFTPKSNTQFLLCGCSSLLLVTNPMIWFQCLKAEVYPFNMLYVLGIVLCIVFILDPAISKSRLFQLSSIIMLLLGLGFTNHSLLTAHIVPAAGLVFLLIIRRYSLSNISVMVTVFFLAISIYLYLPIRSIQNPGMDTGNPENWMNFINAVTRKGTYNRFFGSLLSEWGSNLLVYVRLVCKEMGIGFVLVATVGLLGLLRRNWKIAAFLLISAGTNIAITCVNKNFNANPDTGPAYLMLSNIVIVIGFTSFMIFGAELVSTKLKNNTIVYMILSVVLLIPSVWMIQNHSDTRLSTDESAARVGRGCMDICAPDSAMFFGMYHNLPFVVNYLQIVEKYREDIIPVTRGEMVYWPGGLENLSRRYPFLTDDVFNGPFGESLKYLAPRSARHSETIAYDEARSLLFNNNVWMADSYSEKGTVYWFPSEDDHLIKREINPVGPMFTFASHQINDSGRSLSQLLSDRIHLEESLELRLSKGGEVLATYFDLQCITLQAQHRFIEARTSRQQIKRYSLTLSGNCKDL